MADNNEEPKAKPAAPPTPVHIGGETLADRIAPHVKKIMVAVILIAVIVTIVLAFRWRKHVGQEKQTEKLAKVLDEGRAPVGPETLMPGQPASTEKRFTTAKERAIAMLDSMAKAGAEGTPTFKGSLLLDAGRTDEAIASYRKGTTAKGLDGVIAREGLGIALETKAIAEADAGARQKLLEEALATFTAMQPDEAGPRRAYALYHQGRLQQEYFHKPAEAKALFEKAKELGASTELPDLIERRLAAL
ncbi:MAG: hypothetical protein SFX73_36740 [Kofleriaceae bacterium]|nr:hypothetical protein [Kofleriaceae bacterium]